MKTIVDALNRMSQTLARADSGAYRADKEFKEENHPRAEDGKFGSKAGVKAGKLSAKEKSYISSYTGDDFLETNTKLRNGEDGGVNVKSIDAAINKSVLGATILYRGMDREAAKKLFKSGSINVGDLISDPAFLSTSRRGDFGPAKVMGGVQLKITTGENQQGLDVSNLTRNPSEEEVLLPRNTKLKVTGIIAPKKPGDPVVVKVTTILDDARDDAAARIERTVSRPRQDRIKAASNNG
jgi:hypothetical protein